MYCEFNRNFYPNSLIFNATEMFELRFFHVLTSCHNQNLKF